MNKPLGYTAANLGICKGIAHLVVDGIRVPAAVTALSVALDDLEDRYSLYCVELEECRVSRTYWDHATRGDV